MIFLRAIIMILQMCQRRQTSNCFFAANNLQEVEASNENFQRISRRLLSMSIQYHRSSCVHFLWKNRKILFLGWQQPHTEITQRFCNKINIEFSRIMSFCVACYHGLLLSRWKIGKSPGRGNLLT